MRFSPTNDTYMDSATLQHGDRHLLIVGNSSLPGERKRTLLKYNVSSITRCSLIREVHLLTPVNSTKSLRQANNITAHAVRSDWQESAVSSRHRTSTDDWVEAFLGPANQPPNGVDAKERAEGSEEVTEISVSRSYTPKIKIQTQTVCNWIANPRSGNKGLLLRANCENSSCGEIRFNSRESGLSAPLLEVCLINEGWKGNFTDKSLQGWPSLDEAGGALVWHQECILVPSANDTPTWTYLHLIGLRPLTYLHSTYTRTYIHTYIHLYINIHTYIHLSTYIHT